MPFSRLVATAAALTLAACATASSSLTTSESAGEVALADARAPVLIRVTSRYAGPLAIYAVSDGVATRLGEVPGGRVEQFQLAATQIPENGLSLMAVPRDGDQRATTARLRVAPGNVVELTIGAVLGDARATVRLP